MAGFGWTWYSDDLYVLRIYIQNKLGKFLILTTIIIQHVFMKTYLLREGALSFALASASESNA